MATLDNNEPNANGTSVPAAQPAAALTSIPPAVPDDDADKPYVGPRTFQPSEWQRFFGRDREARDLVARIISERFTLFYAQSGAGKSSLINTRVLPGLVAEGFEVLPIARVSGHAGAFVSADNIFVYNLLSSLHQQETAPPGLGSMTITHFLDSLVCHDGAYFYDPDYEWPADAELQPRVLIIDQFEEITTTNSTFWEQREPFFQQLGEALEADDSLWVVLSLREDFLAGLDRYLHLVNKGVRQRFYMQQLNRNAAIEAICRPVAERRPFEPGAVEELVDNLMTSRLDEVGDGIHQAEFVEPVQLQAVCYQMWEKLQTRPGRTITLQDVRDFADVDTALVSFYEDTVADTIAWAATQPNLTITETDLRHWFETSLVTEVGTRNMVFRGQDETGGLPTAVADYVRSRFIMREVVRPGGVWYELVHDGFIKPIRDANRKWLQQQPLLQLAQQWVASGHNETRLLTGRQFDEFSATKWQALGPQVAAFMEASRLGRQNYERRKRFFQMAGIAAAFVLLAGAVLTLIVSVRNSQSQNLNLANANATKDANATVAAQANREVAAQNDILSTREAELAAANREVEALRLIDAASDYLAQNRLDAAILLSRKAYAQDPSPRVRAVLFQAMDNKIEQIDMPTPLRGAYALPVDDAGNDLLPESLLAGPTPDTLAAIVGGRLFWWTLATDTESRPLAQQFPLPADAAEPIRAAAFSPEGDVLVTAADALRVWLIEDGAATRPVDVPTRGEVNALAFSGDGRRLAAAYRCHAYDCSGSEIAIWDLATADGIPSLTETDLIATSRPVVDITFADARGEQLIWADGSDVIIESTTAAASRPLSKLSAQKQIISGVAAAPAGNLLVVSGCDEIVDTSSGRLSSEAAQGRAATRTPTPTPTATPLPAGEAPRCGVENTPWLEIWFVGSENPFGFRLPGRLQQPTYQPDEDRFLFVSADRDAPSLPFWSADPAAWQANACAVAGRNLTADEWRDLNPGLPLERYTAECTDHPIHPSVIEVFLSQCIADPASDETGACWLALEENFGLDVSPDAIRQAQEKTAAARASFSAQRRTTALRELTEAELLVDQMPEAIATHLRSDILGIYADVCTADVFTDSPTIREACTHGTTFTLGGGQYEAVADAGMRLWRFEAQAGQSVTIGVEALEGGDPTLSLLNGRLEVISTNDDFNGFNPEITYQVIEDGLYIIGVDWLGEPGAYVLRVASNTPRPLAVGESVAVEDAQRFWQIDGRAGEAITIHLEAKSEADPWLRLTDSMNVELGFNDNANDFLPQINAVLPADGAYVIEVGWNGAPVPYNIFVDTATHAPLTIGDIVDNDDPGQASWQFEGQAGDYVTIAVEATDADPTLTLTGPNGLNVYNDDFNGRLNPQVEALLTADGTYIIEVGWLSLPTVYTLKTSRAQPEDVSQGTTLRVGPEQRLFRFDGRAGDRITLTARALNEGDSWMRLLDEAFNELAYSDNDGGSLDPRIVVTLPDDGAYLVELAWFGEPDEAELTIGGSEPQLIAVGQTVQGDVGQTSWRLEGNGQLVTLELAAEGGFLSVFGVDDQPVSYFDSLGDMTHQLSTRLPDGEPIFIEVNRSDAPLGDYTLSVNLLEPPQLALDEVIAEIGPEQRLWAFDGQAGDFVIFAAQSLDGGDLFLDLLNDRFDYLATNFDFAGLPDPQIGYLLPADGRYYVLAGWSGTPGFYALSATTGEATALPLEVTVEEAGASAPWIIEAEAGPLAVELETLDGEFAWMSVRDAQNIEVGFADWNTQQTGRQNLYLLPEDGLYLIEVGGADGAPPYRLRVAPGALDTLPLDESVAGGADGRSQWLFRGQAGDIFTAVAQSLDGGDTMLTLLNPEGVFLAESDDFNDYDPRLTYELPADGIYQLLVTWQDWSGIADLAVPVAPQFGPYRLTAAVVDAQPLSVGQVVEGAAGDGLWRIDGRAGDTITLAATALTGGDNLWLRLLDDQFQPVAFSDNADGLNPRLTVELPGNGVYYVEVGWHGEAGTYRLTAE